MTTPPIIFFEFAGRESNLEAQRPHITALLDQYPGSVLHLWDLTREAGDARYIRDWALLDHRIRVLEHFHPGHPYRCMGDGVRWDRNRGRVKCGCVRHKPPYEAPYQWYVDQREHIADDTVFVKLDDDIVWIDTDNFWHVLDFLSHHPNSVASANVTNNVACAKYEPTLREQIEGVFNPQTDLDWWQLHTSPDFALVCHNWLLDQIQEDPNLGPGGVVRVRPGEYVSINFIAFTMDTMVRFQKLMTGRLGDEGAIDSFLPWIIRGFRVAHLTFGPQERDLPEPALADLRSRYSALPHRVWV